MQGLDTGGRVKGINRELYILQWQGRGIHVHHSEQIGGVRRPGQFKLQGIDQEEVQRRSQAAADTEEEGCGRGAVAGRGAQGLIRLRQGISRKGEGRSAYFLRARLLSLLSLSSSSSLLSSSSSSLLSSLSSSLSLSILIVTAAMPSTAVRGNARTSHNKEQTVSGKGEKQKS